jgi:hypothetical protein
MINATTTTTSTIAASNSKPPTINNSIMPKPNDIAAAPYLKAKAQLPGNSGKLVFKDLQILVV